MEKNGGDALVLKRRKERSLETPRRPDPATQGGGALLRGIKRASGGDRAVGGKEEVASCCC
jgi:hypothetical protein